MGAVVEAALAQKRLKFGKIALQVFLVEMLGLVHVEGREARRVRDKGFVSERIELDVAGGVPSAAELVADLADFDRKLGRERIEKARFTDAGVPREGAKLSSDGLPQRGDSLAGLCARAQDSVGGLFIDGPEPVAGVEVAFVDADDHLAADVARERRDPVDEKRVRHGVDRRREHNHAVDVRDRGPQKAVFSLADRRYRPLAVRFGRVFDDVADEGAHALQTELSARAALVQFLPVTDVVEATEGLDDSSRSHQPPVLSDAAEPDGPVETLR